MTAERKRERRIEKHLKAKHKMLIVVKLDGLVFRGTMEPSDKEVS